MKAIILLRLCVHTRATERETYLQYALEEDFMEINYDSHAFGMGCPIHITRQILTQRPRTGCMYLD